MVFCGDRCLTRIYSSLDRVEKFSPFLLNCTANTLESLTTALDTVSHLACIDTPFIDTQHQSSDEEEAELVDLLSKLWQLYMDLDVGLRMQEVTTPAVHLLPKLKCKTSGETPRVKSPLARVSMTRFRHNDSDAE